MRKDITETAGEQEKMLRHRDGVHLAEMSRLNGDSIYTPEELDAKIEALLNARQK